MFEHKKTYMRIWCRNTHTGNVVCLIDVHLEIFISSLCKRHVGKNADKDEFECN